LKIDAEVQIEYKVSTARGESLSNAHYYKDIEKSTKNIIYFNMLCPHCGINRWNVLLKKQRDRMHDNLPEPATAYCLIPFAITVPNLVYFVIQSFMHEP